jgi:electron transfer flavoprotein alpha subunit
VNPAREAALCALVPIDDGETHDPWAPVAFARAHADRHGGTVVAIVVGRHPDDDAGREALACGAHSVWLASHGDVGTAVATDALLVAFERAIVQPGVVAGLPGRGLFLLPAGAVGEELAARLAARFDGVPLGRCLRIEPEAGAMRIERLAYGGRIRATLATTARPLFGAVRRPPPMDMGGSVAPEAGPSVVRRLQVDLAPPPAGFVRHAQVTQRSVPLAGARVIVSGGRGMGGEAGFALLRELADCLGGVVGGSLPTVDAGWMPVTHQIGQSGKYVTPQIYLGVGVSGTPQHMAGIGPDVRIVAINKDAQADIFRIAEIGLVADWRVALPALIARLRSR